VKRTDLVAFVCGALFAVGLALSGMTQPSKILDFLDVAGTWDPTVIFVMIGAIAVHIAFARRASTGRSPIFASTFVVPTATAIDRKLVTGAALFGLGWGIAGFCPGPALVSLVAHSTGALLFVASMITGMIAHTLLVERKPKATPAVEC
jgi:uncharacterized membrane protein YedE/YeeE